MMVLVLLTEVYNGGGCLPGAVNRLKEANRSDFEPVSPLDVPVAKFAEQRFGRGHDHTMQI